MRLHRKGLGKHFKNGLSIIKAKHVYYTKLGKKKKKSNRQEGQEKLPTMLLLQLLQQITVNVILYEVCLVLCTFHLL